MRDQAIPPGDSANSATLGSEAGSDRGHSRHRMRVRHKRRVLWFQKQSSRRMKLLIFLSAVLAVLMAFAILNYMNMPTIIPQQ
jgi:hypothetical protein